MTTTTIPQAFIRKKTKILQSLALTYSSAETYTDKSPKGSVDVPILGLIELINGVEGLVTTSSCSGRVAVFVEGERINKATAVLDYSGIDGEGDDDGGGAGAGDGGGGDDDDEGNEKVADTKNESAPKRTNGLGWSDEGISSENKTKAKHKIKTGPGGKGGGRWLFVSHDPVAFPQTARGRSTNINEEGDCFMKLCGLKSSSLYRETTTTTLEQQTLPPILTESVRPSSAPRLIRLSFSPLILHVLTADLPHHARGLLAAAINAGFRESGVQSLAALNPATSNKNQNIPKIKDQGLGTMVAIRTAGLAFETIIGQVIISTTTREEIIQPLVTEEYLELCFQVINERFAWNEQRKKRLEMEIRRSFVTSQVSNHKYLSSDMMDQKKSPPIEKGVEKKKKVWEDKDDRRRRMREEGLRRQQQQQQQQEQALLSHGSEVERDDNDTAEEGEVVVDVGLFVQAEGGGVGGGGGGGGGG